MSNPLRRLWARWRPLLGFSGSQDYWRQRYRRGGDSGAGSGGESARFKASVLNAFVRELGVDSVIEFGCGDGRQLELSEYPNYSGLDISQEAVNRCRKLFFHDATKSFSLVEDYDGAKADLSISLDVLFHLVEDEVYDSYLRMLFGASSRYVIIYSSDEVSQPPSLSHVRHRHVSRDVARRFQDFTGFDPKVDGAGNPPGSHGVPMKFLFYRRVHG